MSNKKDKGKVVSITDAEIIEKTLEPATTEANQSVDTVVRNTLQDTEQTLATRKRLEALQADLIRKHQEKGSLAFELLKSVVAQKAETIAHIDHTALVNSVYALADNFKSVLDERFTKETEELTSRLMGKSKEVPATKESGDVKH
jgi:tRNA U55 pseudouridine synthase TruB